MPAVRISPSRFKLNSYVIRGLPSTHIGWISLKWMPRNKVFRVTYSPPIGTHMTSSWINLKNNCHTEYDCVTLEEAEQVIQNLADKPLSFNRPD